MTGRGEDDPLHAAIDAKLAQVAGASPTPPPWHEAWTRLGPDSTEEERLAVYRAVRAAGSVPEKAGFYLVSWQIDAITLGRADEGLRGHEDRVEAVRKAHGLAEDDYWPPGEGPPDYQEAQRQLHDAWEALYAVTLDELGEQEMARLFRTDRGRFDRLSEAGRAFFHGPRTGGAEED